LNEDKRQNFLEACAVVMTVKNKVKSNRGIKLNRFVI